MWHPAQGPIAGYVSANASRLVDLVGRNVSHNPQLPGFRHVCDWLALVRNLKQTKPSAFRDGLVAIVYP